MNKTYAPNSKKIQKEWYFIDASDQILGKLATDIAVKLMGKNKPVYAPNADVGDKVVVTNASQIAVTGNKEEDKLYQHHTGFPGGLRTEKLRHLRERKPTEILRIAVNGMLPKNKLRKVRMSNLYIYEGAEHPHQAQAKNK